jgi:hypothetical protein
MDKCKALLLENGQVFMNKCTEARSKIARIAAPWIPNGAVIHLKIIIIITIILIIIIIINNLEYNYTFKIESGSFYSEGGVYQKWKFSCICL